MESVQGNRLHFRTPFFFFLFATAKVRETDIYKFEKNNNSRNEVFPLPPEINSFLMSRIQHLLTQELYFVFERTNNHFEADINQVVDSTNSVYNDGDSLIVQARNSGFSIQKTW